MILILFLVIQGYYNLPVGDLWLLFKEVAIVLNLVWLLFTAISIISKKLLEMHCCYQREWSQLTNKEVWLWILLSIYYNLTLQLNPKKKESLAVLLGFKLSPLPTNLPPTLYILIMIIYHHLYWETTK